MGRGHAHALYVHEHTSIHRMSAESKVVAAFFCVGAIALTPREAMWAFAAYGALLLFVTVAASISVGFVLARLLAVVPFILFAVFIPFVSGGEQTEVFGLELSVEGLWSAWNIFTKALLGATTSILLTATTEISEVIRGLRVLRVPAVFTAIALFMIRYLELISDELGRMRVAMSARGYDPRWLAQAKPIASSAGALFVRSYERGERVHAAMLSRGFDGTMPVTRERRVTGGDWAMVAGAIAVSWALSVTAMVVT